MQKICCDICDATLGITPSQRVTESRSPSFGLSIPRASGSDFTVEAIVFINKGVLREKPDLCEACEKIVLAELSKKMVPQIGPEYRYLVYPYSKRHDCFLTNDISEYENYHYCIIVDLVEKRKLYFAQWSKLSTFPFAPGVAP